MSAKVNWRGDAVLSAIAAAAKDAITEIDLRIEAAAKKELYPGHGKRTGNLQRSIQGSEGVIEGNRVRGSVGTKGVKYAFRIHQRYKYLLKGLDVVRPQAMAILSKHVKKASGG